MTTSEGHNGLSEHEQLANFMKSANDGQPVSSAAVVPRNWVS